MVPTVLYVEDVNHVILLAENVVRDTWLKNDKHLQYFTIIFFNKSFNYFFGIVLTGLTKQQDSKDENMLILYAISAVLSMSLIINGFLLVWYVVLPYFRYNNTSISQPELKTKDFLKYKKARFSGESFFFRIKNENLWKFIIP